MSFPADQRQPSLLLDAADGKATGFAGCNGFFTTYRREGGSLAFGPVATTRRTCPGGEAVETKLLDAPARTTGWRISSGELLLLKAMASVAGLVRPIAMLPPDWLPRGSLAALVLVIGLCLVVGMIGRTRAGRAARERVEHSLFQRMPGYALLRSLTRRFAGEGQENAWQPATAEIEEALVPGFIIEELDDGRFTVFVPSVPTPLAGSVYILERGRVHPLDVPLTQAVRVISRWGEGSRELVATMERDRQLRAPVDRRVDREGTGDGWRSRGVTRTRAASFAQRAWPTEDGAPQRGRRPVRREPGRARPSTPFPPHSGVWRRRGFAPYYNRRPTERGGLCHESRRYLADAGDSGRRRAARDRTGP